MKNKYIFGGVIIAVFLVLMGYLFTQSNIEYADDFAKVMTTQKTVKATGSWVKEKNYQVDNKNKKTLCHLCLCGGTAFQLFVLLPFMADILMSDRRLPVGHNAFLCVLRASVVKLVFRVVTILFCHSLTSLC